MTNSWLNTKVVTRLGEKYAPTVARYVRRYLQPVAELFRGKTIESDHDVITKLWFDNQADYETTMRRLAEPDVVAEIVADEETLFDRSKHRVFIVSEYDSPAATLVNGGDLVRAV